MVKHRVRRFVTEVNTRRAVRMTIPQRLLLFLPALHSSMFACDVMGKKEGRKLIPFGLGIWIRGTGGIRM